MLSAIGFGLFAMCAGATLIVLRGPVARVQIGWQRMARFHWGRIPTQREVERAFVLVGVFCIAGGVLAIVGPWIWP